ncbi:MAG: porin [Rikenellaceae bacterium]|nr:porin [Rikenellaceae bacterium]
MKVFRLLFASALACVCTLPSLGQVIVCPQDDRPCVIITGKAGEKAADMIIEGAIDYYYRTHVTGFQQSSMPRFVITGQDHRFMLGIGGFVNFRTAYDFEGAVQDLDFETFDIPIPGDYRTRQDLFMDASTSRLFFKAIANVGKLGPIVTYIETDFRGTPNGNLRLRQAYISFKGFLFGRNVTTFCDLDASPTTIDFQGPNAYNFNFNQMIRYTHTFGDKWTIGAALEMPQSSITETRDLVRTTQRLPDLPVYAQFSWNRKRSHVRVSGIFRDLYYHDLATNKNESAFGWGVQFSGNVNINKRVILFSQFTYGQGITPYLQDITGAGLDLVPNPNNMSKLQTLPMMGWFAAAQINLSRRVFCSGGFSQVRVNERNDYHAADVYRIANYAFGNIFWKITPSMQTAIEYLYGTRKNMGGAKNHANRVQAMIQYNF